METGVWFVIMYNCTADYDVWGHQSNKHQTQGHTELRCCVPIKTEWFTFYRVQPLQRVSLSSQCSRESFKDQDEEYQSASSLWAKRKVTRLKREKKGLNHWAASQNQSDSLQRWTESPRQWITVDLQDEHAAGWQDGECNALQMAQAVCPWTQTDSRVLVCTCGPPWESSGKGTILTENTRLNCDYMQLLHKASPPRSTKVLQSPPRSTKVLQGPPRSTKVTGSHRLKAKVTAASSLHFQRLSDSALCH